MSGIMEPFRHLLKPNTPFIWNNSLQEKFEQAKVMIISAVTEGIMHFETSRPTCLATDWCKSEMVRVQAGWPKVLQRWMEAGPGRGKIHNPCRKQVFTY